MRREILYQCLMKQRICRGPTRKRNTARQLRSLVSLSSRKLQFVHWESASIAYRSALCRMSSSNASCFLPRLDWNEKLGRGKSIKNKVGARCITPDNLEINDCVENVYPIWTLDCDTNVYFPSCCISRFKICKILMLIVGFIICIMLYMSRKCFYFGWWGQDV